MEGKMSNEKGAKYFWVYISIILVAVFVFIYVFSLIQEDAKNKTESLQGQLHEQKVFADGLVGIAEENEELRTTVNDMKTEIEQLRAEIELLKQQANSQNKGD
ncbi:MAG: DASH complex subunit SPC34 [Oscillospiraceae bacterium]|nr:DASH complex subunit SPC34 [Oscillospiraceae bacterium]